MSNSLVVLLVVLALWAGIGINTMLITTGSVGGICTMEEPGPARRR